MSIKKIENELDGGSMNISNHTVTTQMLVVTPPKIVGYLIPVKGVWVGIPKMPSKFHQWTMNLVFGFEFEENK